MIYIYNLQAYIQYLQIEFGRLWVLKRLKSVNETDLICLIKKKFRQIKYVFREAAQILQDLQSSIVQNFVNKVLMPEDFIDNHRMHA